MAAEGHQIEAKGAAGSGRIHRTLGDELAIEREFTSSLGRRLVAGVRAHMRAIRLPSGVWTSPSGPRR